MGHNENNHKYFDAKKNDIFALGVCLFMMIVGISPWKESSFNDPVFVHIMNGNIESLLQRWDQYSYLNQDIIQLFHHFFQFESKRITIDDIKRSKWLK